MKNVNIDGIRRDWTEKFRTAYELAKRLAAVDAADEGSAAESTPVEDAASRAECARHVRPFDSGIGAGQVRLLWGVESIAYALVARKWDETSWLVIPFSPFSAPATDTELKMLSDGGLGLRVLQLWNAFSVLDETLAKSWLVHTLPAEDVRDALDVWRWSVGRGDLTESQTARTGLPITHRDDVRVAYRKEQIDKFAKLHAEDLALAFRRAWEAVARKAMAGMRNLRPFGESPVFDSDLALAAAEMPKPVSADCPIPGLEGMVRAKYSPADRNLSLRVYGADGEYSDALDGWGVFGNDGELLGTIAGSAFLHAFAGKFDGILCLADGEGHVYQLLSAPAGET